MTQQKQLEAILEEALLVWKQDYPKSDGDNGLLMDEYFERLEKAKLKATQAITALIQEAERRVQVKCAAEMSILDQEITSLKAEIKRQRQTLTKEGASEKGLDNN